ncbi:hypothetical protein KFL_004740110 [Klebsormidium nitens]|uniref:Ubiquitin thioesterase OTU n=1 Tax=Klebsormidium nitens TaxID=105231 RepID=A0A1Y1IDH5_KLENI|nr:hypothetical protein KFL_004740110 [Klebsormidium nitens]|eukprot:GAQ88970.1 hypothetical protein KFL_004740110 [Klebsormidium nitens]
MGAASSSDAPPDCAQGVRFTSIRGVGAADVLWDGDDWGRSKGGQLLESRMFELEIHTFPERGPPLASMTNNLFTRDWANPILSNFKLRRVQRANDKKPEHLRLVKIRGDGKCLFRAMACGLAANKGEVLGFREEEEADSLRLAVHDALCTNERRRRQYEEALIAITLDQSVERYCTRLSRPDFWGGEPEMLVLSRMLKLPIYVYVPESTTRFKSALGSGFVPIQQYGEEFEKSTKTKKPRKPVRLLYNGHNHFDLLIP